MDKSKDPKRDSTHGVTPGFENASAAGPIGPDGQHKSYWVLSQEERDKGLVRPVRRSYVHNKRPLNFKCGAATKMGFALAETYARNPKFYSHTFCVGCGDHFPVGEFTWDGTEEKVGS